MITCNKCNLILESKKSPSGFFLEAYCADCCPYDIQRVSKHGVKYTHFIIERDFSNYEYPIRLISSISLKDAKLTIHE